VRSTGKKKISTKQRENKGREGEKGGEKNKGDATLATPLAPENSACEYYSHNPCARLCRWFYRGIARGGCVIVFGGEGDREKKKMKIYFFDVSIRAGDSADLLVVWQWIRKREDLKKKYKTPEKIYKSHLHGHLVT
jgi:hypothetical protein